MAMENGARLARHRRGDFAASEIPATDTAAKRGRLRARAKQGDLAARKALTEWDAAERRRKFEELEAARTATD